MFTSETIDFAEMPRGKIAEKLKERGICLTVDEILKIQKEILHRPPSLTECVLWSIQGSEHCSYKSSRKFLKQFPADAPNVMLGPKEDAGIVEAARSNDGHRYGIVVSHESHNHPSQIVPYEGAATGVGGNVRDVACMGAKVVAIADPLRFGSLTEKKSRVIADGVISGIAGYGNPIGVPNIGGDIYFDSGYNDNCLANVVTLGALRDDEIIHSKAPANSDGYNLILVGKPTDNSGFGGASFASLSLKEEQKTLNKGAVQEPNAFLKRHLLKANYALFGLLKERHLLDRVGFKDLGAGGIACASVELADAGGMGAEVHLDKAHKSMEDLHPSIILCSETQERFMWVAPPEITKMILDHYNKTFALPKISTGASACVIGTIKSHGNFVVMSHGQEIVHAKASEVTRGLRYDRSYKKPDRVFTEPDISEPRYDADLRMSADMTDIADKDSQSVISAISAKSAYPHHIITYNQILLKILAHENVASRAPIYERYDKNVQGITAIEPGEADAGVIQPFKYDNFPEEIRKTGVALAVGHNPRYNKIDPYWGGVNAIVEAMRNAAAVGAVPQAITDCLNYGNPEKEGQMWEFAEGARGLADACKGIHLKHYPDFPTPIISGNVSLYNESNGKAIPPSPMVSCIATIPDVCNAITMHFKRPGSCLFLIGPRKDECGGSVYYSLFGELGANAPKPDLCVVQSEIYAITDAIQAGLVLSAHDISDGGVSVALAEMSFRNEFGCEVNIPGDLRADKKLFGETGGFVLEIAPECISMVENIFSKNNAPLARLGKTTNEKRLKMNGVIDMDLLEAKRMWTNGLRNKL